MPVASVQQTVRGDHNIFTATGDVNIVYQLPPAEASERRLLLTLLGKVRQFWIQGVLESSLHGTVAMELGKSPLVETVNHPWARVLELPDRAAPDVMEAQNISEVFESAGRLLLIASEPGCGKTTTLLELGREWVAKAERDPAQAIPVVFNLSTWSERRLPLRAWLLAELSSKYYVPRNISSGWLDSGRLLLLLDGLDEVGAEHRAACVGAINAFLHHTGVPGLAVCCRLDEYKALPAKLALSGAVCLQPFTAGQVDHYVEQFGPPLQALRQMLERDATLQSLAGSPLLLSIMCLTCLGQAPNAVPAFAPGTLADYQHQILEAYVDRMFRRRDLRAGRWPREQTVKGLSWLAWQLQRHGQTVFQIENLQPSWLPKAAAVVRYATVSRMAGASLLGLAEGLFLWWLGLVPGAGEFGLVRLSLAKSATCGVLVGLLFGFGLGLMDGWRLLGRKLPQDLGAMESRWLTLVRILALWAWFALVLALVGLPSGRDAFGLIWALMFGLRGRQQSLNQDIQPVEAFKWSWAGAARGALGGLIVAVLLDLVIFIGLFLGGMVDKAATAPAEWFVFVPFYALLGTAFGGLSGRTLQTKVTTNQGIRLSLRNGLFGAVTAGALSILAIGASFELLAWNLKSQEIMDYFKRIGWPHTPGYALLWLAISLLVFSVPIGAYFGVFGWLWYGGMDALQHAVLRRELRRKGATPPRYAQFLDHAVELVFLRKVGGGFIFVHRLLLDYFAALHCHSGTRDAGFRVANDGEPAIKNVA